LPSGRSKAGDWIVIGGHERVVRKISVRSTEIETFDRVNVIVPNSMLIAETVKNWTLHNSTGRMTIPVGVHYDSDPEKVRDILLGAAREHPQVLSNPAPFVYFADFGRNSLEFTLYIYLANVNRSLAVRTDLRMAILKSFRKEGIEIPYQQADIHLRDLDWLKQAVRSAGQDGNGSASRRDYKSESEEPDHGDGGH
jgi:potassium efflux system protein